MTEISDQTVNAPVRTPEWDPPPPPDPLKVYEGKDWITNELTKDRCGDGSICVAWNALVYLQDAKVDSCQNNKGEVIYGATQYNLITIPETKELFRIRVREGQYAIMHKSWPIPCANVGVWAKRFYEATDYGEACTKSIMSYCWDVAGCRPILPPGLYEFGTKTTAIPPDLLCRISPDGTSIATVREWQNKIIPVNVCLEMVDQSYIDSLMTRR